METIYTGTLGQKLFLYTNNNCIYLRSAIGEDVSRPILLGTDFKDSLSSIVFHDSIHFSYINSQGDVLVRNILDSKIIFRLSCESSPDYISPHLHIFQDNLLLFYFIRNPLNESFLLHAVFPCGGPFFDWTPIPFLTLPQLNCITSASRLFLICTENRELSAFRIHKDLSHEPVQFMTASDIRRQNETLLQPKDKLIESMKSQYEELRNTAIAYRNEANKWYRKYNSQKESV